jgi:hypothetical protein
MRLLGALLIVVLPASQAATPTARHTLDDVLARAGRYTVEYGEALASVLAEETYEQRLVWRREQGVKQQRQLRSEIAFVRLVNSTEWLTFRNVLAVDDGAIAGSDGRLERLFRNPPVSLVAQARLITRESARFNIGPIARDINVPTTALHFVHPKHRPNSRFNKEREEILDGERVWVIRFRERDRGSLIRGTDGLNLPAVGRLWIVPADGRVVKSELVIEDFVRGRGDSRAEIGVKWRRDVPLDLWVPAEMRERYEGPWYETRDSRPRERYDIDGAATYSNYRRFTVDVRIR